MDTKTIYILYSYQPGDENSCAMGWSESEEELKKLIAQLKKKPKCPYREYRRNKIDALLCDWDSVAFKLYNDALLTCPYYDENSVPKIKDTKKYFEWLDVLEAGFKVKRVEYLNTRVPGITTAKELEEYDKFRESENDYTDYYIGKMNHI